MDKLDSAGSAAFHGADAVFCALGTTRKVPQSPPSLSQTRILPSIIATDRCNLYKSRYILLEGQRYLDQSSGACFLLFMTGKLVKLRRCG